jgi:hypothetical protein
MIHATIERELQRMQLEHTGEHLPLERILEVLHDEEVAPPPFFRRIDVPSIKQFATPGLSERG